MNQKHAEIIRRVRNCGAKLAPYLLVRHSASNQLPGTSYLPYLTLRDWPRQPSEEMQLGKSSTQTTQNARTVLGYILQHEAWTRRAARLVKRHRLITKKGGSGGGADNEINLFLFSPVSLLFFTYCYHRPLPPPHPIPLFVSSCNQYHAA